MVPSLNSTFSVPGAPPFNVVQPFAGVFYVRFPQRPGLLGEVDLAFHFLRFQEHYESPGFKGRVFSWAQYVAWYRQVRGYFSYPWDWAGYNFPGRMLEPFRSGAFDPLTRRERALLDALAQVRPGDYVIGTLDQDAGALQHELAHACFELDPLYRERVLAALAGGDYSRQAESLAEGEGYDPQVHLDEIQAHAVEGGELGPGARRSALIREAFDDSLDGLRRGPAGAIRRAYQDAVYEIREGSEALALRVGMPSAPLAALLRSLGVSQASLVTAHNPASRPQLGRANAAAQQRLEARLRAEGHALLLPGRGRDPSGSWPDEDSVLVPGMDVEGSLRLARDFGQHAVLALAADGVPRLAYVSALPEAPRN